MSGILGVIHWEDTPEKTTFFQKAFDRLRHRGLAASRFQTFPEAEWGACLSEQAQNEIQPYTDPSGSFTILFDGRLDNRQELLSLLKEDFQNLSSDTPDLQLALAAFQKWNAPAPSRFLGDFALAIWNHKERRLFLARDYIGVKPLYYFRNQKRFYFCSEIAPLFAFPEIPKTPNPAMIGALLTGDLQDPDATFFKDIQQVRPGHSLTMDSKGSAQIHRYWQPPIEIRRHGSPETYEEEFWSLFASAVKDRLRSQAPVGNLLSGGLDSTQITAMAEFLRKTDSSLPPLYSVTWLPNGILNEDLEAIDHLKRLYGTTTQWIEPDPTYSRRSNMEYFCEVGETPHIDCFSTLSFLLDPLAQKGCKRVLAGTAGNELGFYPEIGHLHDLLLRGHLVSFRREIHRLSKALAISSNEAYAWLISETFRELIPRWARTIWKQNFHRSLHWLKPSLRALLPQTSQPRQQTFSTLSQEMCYRQFAHPWFAMSLNQLDHGAAQRGMEICHPYLDRRIVTFLLQVPGEIKIAGGYRKMFLQRALQPVVQMNFRAIDRSDCRTPDQETERSLPFQVSRLKFYLSNPDSFIYNYVEYDWIQTFLD